MGAAAQAQHQEDERQRRIRNATAAINAAFDYGDNGQQAQESLARYRGLEDQFVQRAQELRSYSRVSEQYPELVRAMQAAQAELAAIPKTGRDQYYDEIQGNVQERLTNDLNTEADRIRSALTSELARRGLTGGSADIQARALYQDQLSRGAERVASSARGARSSLQSADESARSELLGQALAGISSTDVAERASARAQSDLDAARGQINLSNLGDVFSSLIDSYGLYNTGVQQGNITANIRRGNYLPAINAAGGGYGGTLTS